ncbi:MAG: hypothetical protein ABI162_11550 [Luteolibacter sp.]
MKPKSIANLFTVILFAATGSIFTAGYASATDIAGNNIPGSLTVGNSITTGSDINAGGGGNFGSDIYTPGWGVFESALTFGAGGTSMLFYDGTTNTASHDSYLNYAAYKWAEGWGVTPRTKMVLTSANKLSLYESNGGNSPDRITLEPNTGKIALNGPTSTSGIYFVGGGSTATLAATSTGMAIFPNGAQVSGSPVVTAAGLGTALDNLTTPPASAAWSTMYVKRGNIGGGNGLLGLGTGVASVSGAVALSNGSTASGLNSLAVGASSTAASVGSIAMGALAKTYAPNSIAIGNSAQAGTSSTVGVNSVAFGNSAKTLADYSIALGTQSESSGKYAVSIGSGKAAGVFSLAATGGHSDGDVSIALGGWWSNGTNAISPGPNTATGLASTAIGGLKNTVTGKAAYVSGVFNSPSAAVSTTFGSAAIGGGSSSAWVENEPLFELGNTAVDLSTPVEPTTGRTNAITTLKNGQTTLTNKAWKSDPAVAPVPANSNGEALVVQGHTRLSGNTTMEGKIIISVPQGDISMGIYGN